METINTIISFFPQLTPYAKFALLIPAAGRIWHAFKIGGGFMGAWRAIMYGTNVPPTPKDNAADTGKPN